MSEIKVNSVVNSTGDNDSGLDLATNDQVKVKIANAEDFIFKANSLEVQTGSNIDMNGTELILDADGDTSITSDTDDQIDFKIGGNDTHVFNASGHITLKQFLDTATAGGVVTGASNRGDVARIRLFQSATGSDGGEIRFDTANTSNSMTERMRVDSDGRLLVGTTSSGYSDTGCRISSGGGIQNTVSGGQLLRLNRTTSTGNMVQFWYNGGEKGTITTNGSNVAYNTSSDYRLKENVVTDWDATTRLKQLKPSRFNFIADADTTVDGFLAHEVSSIVPEAITGEKDAVDLDGNIQPQAIDQSKLVPLLTKALQEAVAKIETLETAKTDLEARITALEGG